MTGKNKVSKSQPAAKMAEPIIPARIVVGVTGHRKLNNKPKLARQTQWIIEKIKQLLPSFKKTPLSLTILSPLAEGADRLVAREILKMSNSQLEVVLPLEKDDYLKDFEDQESKAEFEKFLSQARRIKNLPPTASRTEAYAQVGRYVVDNCDVLIALWNGKPAAGQGGTAEIVEYARRKKCPLFWVHTEEDAKITYERGNDLSIRPFLDLDKYNSEPVDNRKINEETKAQNRFLLKKTEEAQFLSEDLPAINEQVLPHYNRADILALRYQHLYLKAGSLVYTLAAAAVAVVAFQAIFLHNLPRVALIEVLFIFGVLAIVWLGNRQRWHAKWIDYRFLAERFRSALFMAVANVDVTTLRPPRHLSLSYSSQDWMVSAFSSFWSQIPPLHELGLSKFEGLRKFILEAWINDQILYHQKTSKRHWGRHRRMMYAGNILFGLTLIAAVLHILHTGPDLLNRLFLFMAIVFPALAGALGAIRTHREYLRNAMRSTEMVRHLEELKEQMIEAKTIENFLHLVREAEETMLHENEDWRVVVRFHELEPPA